MGGIQGLLGYIDGSMSPGYVLEQLLGVSRFSDSGDIHIISTVSLRCDTLIELEQKTPWILTGVTAHSDG